MKSNFFTLGFVLAVCTFSSAFAGTSERTSDLHTQVPEFLAKDKTWGFHLGFGATSITGNTKQATGNANLALFNRWDSFIAYITGNYFYLGVGDPTRRLANLGSATARADYMFSPIWRWFVFTTHGFNEFQGRDYRGSVGTGPWYQITTDTLTNGLSLAAVYEFEDLSNGDFDRAGRLSLRDVLSLKLSPTAVFGLDFFYTPSMADFSDFRFSLSPSLELSVIQEVLTLKLYAIFERDIRPLAGIEPNDLEMGTTLTLRLGE